LSNGQGGNLRAFGGSQPTDRLVPQAKVKASDSRFLHLLTDALSKMSREISPIKSLGEIRLRKRGTLQGLVGLTSYSFSEYKLKRGWRSGGGRHIITFYSGLLNQLSCSAAVGVIAHELAHAWLNEHVKPDQSERREREADELAESWGFREELAALSDETDPA